MKKQEIELVEMKNGRDYYIVETMTGRSWMTLTTFSVRADAIAWCEARIGHVYHKLRIIKCEVRYFLDKFPSLTFNGGAFEHEVKTLSNASSGCDK